jgi:UDP-glucose-4-epimerase GalE
VESILVAGGAGYVGSHACKALARAGYQPVVIDNLATGHADAVKWGPLIKADIGDTDTVLAALDQYGIKAAMHFAASSLVAESVAKPDVYYANNVTATLRLIDALTQRGVRHIVFSSSAAVYGAVPPGLIGEDTPLAPTNPYGETKRVIEGALRWIGEAKGFTWAALRYFNAAGADPDGEIGERHDPETHLIPNVVRAALGTGPGLKIFGSDYPTPDGSTVRDYVHVTDLADAHVAALAWLKAGGASRAFNLGAGEGLSTLEIVAAVETALGRKPAFVMTDRRPGDPPSLVADPAAAKAAFRWTPSRSDPVTMIRDVAAFETARASR